MKTVQSGVLSKQLRQGTGSYLAQRRAVASLSLAAAASMGFISLYQLGIIPHLPDPPLPYFNADTVDAGAEAYRILQTPDAVLGLCSYAATLALAAMGAADREHTAPWLPLALAAKVIGFDTPQAVRLSITQWTKHRAFCRWCLLASAMTCASVPLVLPEARAALRRLRH